MKRKYFMLVCLILLNGMAFAADEDLYGDPSASTPNTSQIRMYKMSVNENIAQQHVAKKQSMTMQNLTDRLELNEKQTKKISKIVKKATKKTGATEYDAIEKYSSKIEKILNEDQKVKFKDYKRECNLN